ncbi:Uncharacterised protein [Pseudomonas putida]|nr:Uncharacterised protein [Pseudomonas putida]
MLGFLDVRTPLQQIRWQAGRDLGQLIGVELKRCRQVSRHASAQQHGQAVQVLGDQALVLREFDPRAFNGGAGLAHIKR